MQVLVDAREKLGIPWEHSNSYLAANQAILFHSNNELDVDTFRLYAPIIRRLWQDPAIKKAYDKRREFQLVSSFAMISSLERTSHCNLIVYDFQSDSVSYFFDELDRISRIDYTPSQKDVLHCRKATKGVFEFTIRIQVRKTSEKCSKPETLYFVVVAEHSICFRRCWWAKDATSEVDQMFRRISYVNIVSCVDVRV